MKPFVLLTILLVISSTPFMLSAQDGQAKERCLTNNEFSDRYASYSPDGNWIVFESNRDSNWNIYLMDKNGSNIQQLTKNTKDNRRPSWHPKGKKILFESNRNGLRELYTIKVKNKKEKRLVNTISKGEFIFATYGPKGKRIAVSVDKGDNRSSIVLLNKKGKLTHTLIDNDKRNFYPKWSPNGKELVYFSRKDTDNKDDEIYSLNLENGISKRLTNWPKHNFCPSWSTDGNKIVYVTSMEDTRPEIYLMNKDGKNPQRLTYNKDGDTLPNWHPKENKILITAYRNGNYQICELVID